MLHAVVCPRKELSSEFSARVVLKVILFKDRVFMLEKEKRILLFLLKTHPSISTFGIRRAKELVLSSNIFCLETCLSLSHCAA